MIGRRIDQYRIDRKLGEGGMGAVYQATDIHLNRSVAFKITHPQLAQRPEFQRRFLQEARAAANLDHPSTVKIFDFGVSEGLLYMVQEFVDGGSLSAYIRRLQERNQVLPLQETLFILAQVADALAYAHRNNIVHRDIKPDNILLKRLDVPEQPDAPPVRAIVTDFGLAKLLDAEIQTQTGTFMGTMAYMSPEQCQGFDLDGRSDIYSLGIVLYQLATGSLPFNISSPTEAVSKHVYTAPPPPEQINPGLPRPIVDIINRALAKQPNDRYPTARQMAEAMRNATRTLSSADVTRFQSVVQTSSLVTQLAESDQMPEPTRLGRDMAAGDVDAIVIAQSGQSPRRVTLDKNVLTIGRTEGNDIVLPDNRVSRRHARLERTTIGWRVLDLDSANGTFLEDSKLLANIPEMWEAGRTLRIGPYFLTWQAAQPLGGAAAGIPGIAAGGQSFQATTPAAVGSTQLHSASGRIGVTVNPTNVAVEPGQRTTQQVQLVNQGITVDHFQVHVDGLPEGWVQTPSDSLQLMPGAQGSIPVIYQPPRTSASRAGGHDYRLTVQAASNAADRVEIAGQVDVAPYHQFDVTVRPTRLRHGRTARVVIRNMGNKPAIYTLTGQDPAEAVRFDGQGKQVTLEGGHEETASMVLAARKRPFLGRPQMLPWTLNVRADDGQTAQQTGQLDVPPFIPSWLVALFALLLTFACIASIWAYQTNQARIANATATAEAFVIAANNQTATSTFLTEQAAQAAGATATSIAATEAALGDDDGDGLSNATELQLGTDPTVADSDNDGLSDGEEVSLHGTSPTDPDSDGDGLKDGDEIALGTLPKIADTDGDGTPDGLDADPLNPPTPTPDLGATAAAEQAENNATATALSAAATQTAAVQQTADAQATADAATAAEEATAAAAATLTAQATTPVIILPPAIVFEVLEAPINLVPNRAIYYMPIIEPGIIKVEASWSGTQSSLALILNQQDVNFAIDRVDQSGSASLTYEVTQSDLDRGGEFWFVSLASFGSGTASGEITISLPDPFSNGTLTLEEDSFTVRPDFSENVYLMPANEVGQIEARAEWTTGDTLALILNGPRQVGYYDRRDGSSPLFVEYDIESADLSLGEVWRTSLISFDGERVSSGTVTLGYTATFR